MEQQALARHLNTVGHLVHGGENATDGINKGNAGAKPRRQESRPTPSTKERLISHASPAGPASRRAGRPPRLRPQVRGRQHWLAKTPDLYEPRWLLPCAMALRPAREGRTTGAVRQRANERAPAYPRPNGDGAWARWGRAGSVRLFQKTRIEASPATLSRGLRTAHAGLGPCSSAMAAVKTLNPKAEVARAQAALSVNISAARGLQEVLRTNLGPKGTMKMLVSGSGDVKLTKDGHVLLHEMQIQHPTASLIAKVATAQDDITGDGTTSNVLIIGELLKQADLYISEGLHPRIITEGFEAAKEKALEFLEQIKVSRE
uniref:Uncharacterized protein LOC109685288 n=1 Tax=Castor canadensis TaxID=51338 RepID=A0A8B7UDD0_CASCN